MVITLLADRLPFIVLLSCFDALGQSQTVTHVSMNELLQLVLSPFEGEEVFNLRTRTASGYSLSTSDQK